MRKGLDNPATQRVLRDAEKVARRQLREDTKVILGTPAGRRWMYWLLYAKCEVESSIAAADPHQTYRLIGRRDVGAELKEYLQAEFPELFLDMFEEAMRRVRQELIEQRRAEALPNPEAVEPPQEQNT